MFIEKLLVNARHIEIQLLGDHHGNVIHLYDRECSIQRRNQKVIEEAPSTFISEETRELMGKTAVKAAKQIGYTNAGTIEFLVDEDENFYFLEMNTRVQVEHGITEEVTHIDIVKEQIKIANNQTLTVSQSDVKLKGHAIEGRIYAEDPVTSFPSPGEITLYTEPTGGHIRIDSGISGPTKITHFYDPMISKLMVKGKDRKEAIELFQKALDAYDITGIKKKIQMLKKIEHNEACIQGQRTTKFIENNKTNRRVIRMNEIVSVMAGNMWKIVVAEGDSVEAGQDIAILESMKMEIPVSTEDAGTIKEIKVNEGDFINEGDVIAIIE